MKLTVPGAPEREAHKVNKLAGMGRAAMSRKPEPEGSTYVILQHEIWIWPGAMFR